VQVYAEQKNKEVTSQEFLDYINQLKEQNPNFKFNQGETKVFDSEEQALANLAEQKQAINTAISNYKQVVEERNTRYEQEKQSVKQQNEQITQENNQKEQEYQTKLSAYNAKKAEVEQWKLATEKMSEIREIRKVIEETKDIQEKSLTYINDLYNKLVDAREYAKQLQLKEENEKKVSEQLDSINSDIQELEIRLKKDIPELDKSLDISNFK
jgi:hypothetical protein